MNLSDEAEVRKRNKEISDKKIIDLAELRKLLEQKPMRNFLWRVLGKTGVFAPQLWEQSAKIHCNAAVRDFGMELWLELEEASQESVFQMMRENKKEEKENV